MSRFFLFTHLVLQQLFKNTTVDFFLICTFVIYSVVWEHSGADSRFKAGSVFREIWSNSPYFTTDLPDRLCCLRSTCTVWRKGDELFFWLRPPTQSMTISSLRERKQKECSRDCYKPYPYFWTRKLAVLFVASWLRRQKFFSFLVCK